MENTTGRVYGYPYVNIESVQILDAGRYVLNATNSLPGGMILGRDLGSFTLDVLCELLLAALWILVGNKW